MNGRCPRCNQFLVSEEWENHICNLRTRHAAEVVFDWISSGHKDQNGDFIRMGLALDGTLYSLITCKHNPPHTAKRKFTGCGTKQGLDRASEEALSS